MLLFQLASPLIFLRCMVDSVPMINSHKNDLVVTNLDDNSAAIGSTTHRSQADRMDQLKKLRLFKKNVDENVKTLQGLQVEGSVDLFLPRNQIGNQGNLVAVYLREMNSKSRKYHILQVVNKGSQGYAVLKNCRVLESNRLVSYENGRPVSTQVKHPGRVLRNFKPHRNILIVLGTSNVWNLVQAEELEATCRQNPDAIGQIQKNLKLLLTARYIERNPGSERFKPEEREYSDEYKFIERIGVAVVTTKSKPNEDEFEIGYFQSDVEASQGAATAEQKSYPYSREWANNLPEVPNSSKKYYENSR